VGDWRNATLLGSVIRPLYFAIAALAAHSAVGQGVPGPIARLAPAAPPVEIVDPEERISGNAATGLVLVHADDAIGANRLWAYLSEPVAKKLKLKISSIDGRYYAEVDYDTGAQQPGWVALDLSLRAFSFLEDNYDDPMSEIAALLSDADEPHFYPVRWGSSHGTTTGPAPEPPGDDDPLRVYMNTERATAFVVVDGNPAYCRDASTVSGFKFNAICDMALGDIRNAEPQNGRRVVSAIEVFRRAGIRSLAPVTLDVVIRY
jgi:hypothetical protein